MGSGLAVPVGCLSFAPEDAFPDEACEVFRAHGVWTALLEFPPIGRVFLPKRGLSGEDADLADKKRACIREELKRLPASARKRRNLLGLLEECDWDVVFHIFK